MIIKQSSQIFSETMINKFFILELQCHYNAQIELNQCFFSLIWQKEAKCLLIQKDNQTFNAAASR